MLRESEAIRSGQSPNTRMIWKDRSDISSNLAQAFIAAEDPRFLEHGPFDVIKIRHAIAKDWQMKALYAGGSTIAQQLARTLYLNPNKTILRKVKEAILASYLELILSKSRILELYLNVVELGPGIYGVEAASHYYYSKSAKEITVEEAISLALILPSPLHRNPRDVEFLKSKAERRIKIMRTMHI